MHVCTVRIRVFQQLQSPTQQPKQSLLLSSTWLLTECYMLAGEQACFPFLLISSLNSTWQSAMQIIIFFFYVVVHFFFQQKIKCSLSECLSIEEIDTLPAMRSSSIRCSYHPNNDYKILYCPLTLISHT